jgi:hypothetical protein
MVMFLTGCVVPAPVGCPQHSTGVWGFGGRTGVLLAVAEGGLPLVQAQPGTTLWFAFRRSDTTYGAFAAFANDQDRDALLSSGGPQLSKKYAHLFTAAPSFDKVDVLEARL